VKPRNTHLHYGKNITVMCDADGTPQYFRIGGDYDEWVAVSDVIAVAEDLKGRLADRPKPQPGALAKLFRIGGGDP
jgi:hypothetical protein